MTGRASVRVPAGAVDMHANVVLSAALTAQAGTDLRRYAQEDGRIVLPATITGTVASPVSGSISPPPRRAGRFRMK